MDGFLRKSTTATLKVGPIVNSTTGAPETGLTITQADVRLSKNGANIAQKTEATSATHDENGYYDVPIDATDTNTEGRLQGHILESGTLVAEFDYMVMSQAAYDFLYGSTALPVNVTAMAAGVVTAAAIATGAIDADAIATDAVTEIQAGLATAAAVDAVDNFLDTELAAITAALIIRENTAQAGAAGSITLDASASAVTDFYKNQAIVITSGTGVGQIRFVSAYNGTTKVATVNENWATTPDNTSVFKVTSARALDAMLSVAGITDAVFDEPQAGHDTAGTIGWMIRQMHSRMAGKAIKTTTTGDLAFYEIDGTTKDFSHLPTTIDATHVALVPTQGP